MNKVNRTFSKRLSRTIMILAVPLFVLSLGVFYQYARELLEKAASLEAKSEHPLAKAVVKEAGKMGLKQAEAEEFFHVASLLGLNELDFHDEIIHEEAVPGAVKTVPSGGRT